MPNQDSPEHDREVIAYELHDGACQYLVAAKMSFEMFRRQQGSAIAGAWTGFDKGITLLTQATEELRRLIGGLRPRHLDGSGLVAAIQQLIAETRVPDGPEIEFYHDFHEYQAYPLSPSLELAVFRIVQECITNSCHHSRSTRILVGLTQDVNDLCVQIQDWGIGFDPAGIRSDRFGLEGVWRRAQLAGGVVTVQSRAGKGTCITVDFPLVKSSGQQTVEHDATELHDNVPKSPRSVRGMSDGAL